MQNITNSNELLTGFLKRIIESAPIIPSDKAILFIITEAIINDIKGKIAYVRV